MRNISGLFILLFVCYAIPVFAEVQIGDTVFTESFDSGKLSNDWKINSPQFVSVRNNALQVSIPADSQSKNASAVITLPAGQLAGARLRVTSRIKAENIAEPPQPWNGIKVMLIIDTPHGKQWLQANEGSGSFDWKGNTFNADIPRDVKSIELLLGIENTTGTVLIDDVNIRVIGKQRSRPAQKADKSKPVYKGHNLPRLRGAMISPGRFKSEDIKVFGGEWKANHVRWQLTWSGFPNGPADTATVEEYNKWIDEQCRLLDEMLPECKKYGVYVCLDVHTPPGGRIPKDKGSTMRMFHEKEFQDAFVALWEKLAKRYKDEKMVWSYDLLNEPVEGIIPENSGLLDWRSLALKTAKAIRKIDAEKAIVLSAAPWGGPDTLEWFEPFDPKEVPNVIYTVHVYVPHSFTHQGVHSKSEPLDYPGKIGGLHWDKETLRKALQNTLDYSTDYGAAIYIGEFSAIRWAPNGSAYRYLKDCIELFEEYGWDWSYHAFREWDGWSVEHGEVQNDRKPTAVPTEREKLLRSWFEKNER
ncbi:MAG: glycoside hydrolase family 5 protein [Planctomycetaceae bacterium]|nr:glycoside hydrolase family 5 protein [Planctomycetaceae bacterium]